MAKFTRNGIKPRLVVIVSYLNHIIALLRYVTTTPQLAYCYRH